VTGAPIARMRLIGSCDPGSVNGAIGLYCPQEDRILAEALPCVDGNVSAAALAARLRQWAPDIFILELASARPGQGVSSMFKYGQAFGTVIGVVQAIGLPLHTVSAGVWKRALGLGPDKEKSRAMALQLWPDRSDLFGLKRQHNNAEAALLALFGAKKFPGAGP
jgi:hypothetical protein